MKNSLSKKLQDEQKRIEKIAKDLGLDFYETVFEMVDYKQMNQIAAQGGFPVRYPHWRFGMEYESLSKSYEYGLSKIYELVINNDPCYAYLLEGNSFLDQKLVMAHVYGHCDFFKNNQWFSQTNRKMMDQTANHATRIRRYIDRHGIDAVESFIDCCLSIDNLIDRYSPYSKVKVDMAERDKDYLVQSDIAQRKDYLNKFIDSGVNKKDENNKENETIRNPERPEKDILKFLIENAPLEDWQQDILSILRDEAYYFTPQGMTKIMNEGWASYWHAKMMTEHICSDSEIVCFADTHAGTMAMQPGGFNPYKIGIEIFRDIKRRWDRGQFGRDWESCEDIREKANWNTKALQGEDKIFEVRRNMNDVTFIDQFLTEDFCVENKFFVYKFNKKTNQFEIDTTDFKAIKSKMLFQLANFGQPIIQVVDSNFEGRGELLMTHLFEGIELQPDYMQECMTRIYNLWKKPINLATVLDEEGVIVRYDGSEFKNQKVNEMLSSEKKE